MIFRSFLVLAVLSLSAPAFSQADPTTTASRPCSVEKIPPNPYPNSMKGSGINGKVVLLVELGTDGCVKSASVLRKVHPELDKAAKRAVKLWKFAPAMKDGHPVAVLMNVEVDFKDPGKSSD